MVPRQIIAVCRLDAGGGVGAGGLEFSFLLCSSFRFPFHSRHCKETCGVDLSKCQQWTKFIEIHYTRPSGAKDRTVFYVPDVWNHYAKEDVKVFKQVQRQEQEVEEEVDVDVPNEEAPAGENGTKPTKTIKKKVVTKKAVENVVIRSMDLSLNGILEYDQQDKQEETAELSLFAESFDEMIAEKFSRKILDILRKKKEDSDKQTAELKRKRESEASERNAKAEKEREERDAKRRKLEEDRKEELERKKRIEEEEKYMTEEQIRERRAKAAEEKKQKDEEERKRIEEENKAKREAEEAKKKAAEEERQRKLEEEKAKKTKTVVTTVSTVNEEILEPFAFFDRPVSSTGQQSNQLKREKVEELLYALGSMCQREVNGYLAAIGLPKDKPFSNLYYKALATTTVVTTKEVPKEEEKKEEPPAAAATESAPAAEEPSAATAQ